VAGGPASLISLSGAETTSRRPKDRGPEAKRRGVGGDGDATLHVGDARIVGALAFACEGAPGGRARGENCVVVAQQRYLCVARPFYSTLR
jgi:hypothetical protein